MFYNWHNCTNCLFVTITLFSIKYWQLCKKNLLQAGKHVPKKRLLYRSLKDDAGRQNIYTNIFKCRSFSKIFIQFWSCLILFSSFANLHFNTFHFNAPSISSLIQLYLERDATQKIKKKKIIIQFKPTHTHTNISRNKHRRQGLLLCLSVNGE